jgi:hypothetical protein
MKTVVDPRRDDIEDDASSTKRRSLLSLVGSLLGEISLPRLAMAWILLLAVPGLILGFAPIVAAAWIGMASRRMMSAYAVICILLLVVIVAVGWFGGRGLFRLAESSFWSLHSLAVQPGYAACREGLRHLAERALSSRATAAQLARLRAAATVAAGMVLSGLAALVLMIAWPSSHWTAGIADFASPHRLAIMVVANCVVLVAAYLAAATLVWTVADATMAQPRDLDEFDVPGGGRTWRIAHLSDIHVVGERYGFRIESGRSGPRGNERLRQALTQLEAIDANDPLDAILITGDVTGRRPLRRVGRVPRRPGFPSAARRARAGVAGQPRRQHRRPCQSGASLPSDKPQQAAAPDTGLVDHRRAPGPSRPYRGSGKRPLGRESCRSIGAAPR